MNQPLPFPPFSRSGTSEDAAAAIDAATLRLMIAGMILRRGLAGMTCWEIEQLTGLEHQTASARLNELESTKDTKRIYELRAAGIRRCLFVVEKAIYGVSIRRPTKHRTANVYFHFGACSPEQAIAHHKAKK